MWQPNSQLIQIEVGSAIVQAVTKPDQRGILGKMFGVSPPEEGETLIHATQQLREYLLKTESLLLPVIHWTDNDQIAPNQVVVYIGLETQTFFINELENIFQFLAYKIREYNQITLDKISIRQLLLNCLEDIKQDEYQYAFEKYQKIYYHSFLQGFNYELTRCLSDAGIIFFKNGDYIRAQSTLHYASTLSDNPNIVDINLKAQIAYNAAEIFKLTQHLEHAYDFYVKAGNAAYYSGNVPLIFLALTSLAEVTYFMRKWDLTLYSLEKAQKLILSDPSPERYKIAFELQRFVTKIYQELSVQQHQISTTPSLFDEIKKLTLSALVDAVVGAAVYKLFGISGGIMLAIFGSSEYKFKGNTVFVKDPKGVVNISDFQN
ncbi:MAG: hypothetical protein HC880_09120 [Bacteroidia bacterium]|nr:hypothetical protein [Bacteroidia bacterium]